MLLYKFMKLPLLMMRGGAVDSTCQIPAGGKAIINWGKKILCHTLVNKNSGGWGYKLCFLSKMIYIIRIVMTNLHNQIF